jgi:hypothetical protein
MRVSKKADQCSFFVLMMSYNFCSGGYLHKNIRVEENAGIRESSYKTWFEMPLLPLLRGLGVLTVYYLW